MQEIECEFHFLLQCPFYDSLQTNFSATVFDKTLFNFKSIMSCSDNNDSFGFYSFGNASHLEKIIV